MSFLPVLERRGELGFRWQTAGTLEITEEQDSMVKLRSSSVRQSAACTFKALLVDDFMQKFKIYSFR